MTFPAVLLPVEWFCQRTKSVVVFHGFKERKRKRSFRVTRLYGNLSARRVIQIKERVGRVSDLLSRFERLPS